MPPLSDILQKYLHQFTRLRQGVTKFGPAPHKPVLLLSILELFEKGEVTENKICITPDLVGTFKKNFALLVTTGHNPDFYLPFYHLAGDGFWHVKTWPGKELNSAIKNFTVLNSLVEYAFLSDDLYPLLLHPDTRNILKTALLNRYFAPNIENYRQAKNGGSYLQDLEKYLLNESAALYLKPQPAPDEEQLFVRGGLFKKLVPQVYNFTCCITGMKLVSSHGYALVDACHIVPFSHSKDDRVTNGLALCPNLHRAFDRGLITVDEKLKVLVSPAIAEDESNVYALKKLEGKRLNLPFGAIHYPATENLAWHREMVFKV